MTTVDHRQATGERNAQAILDATERLLTGRSRLSMAAIAEEAELSRPTLYAHYKTLAEVLEKAVMRAVDSSVQAIEATQPEVGPADQALERMLEASWGQIARQDALARAVGEHLPPDHLHRTHARLMGYTHDLVERGQREGAFRKDLPANWLVTVLYSLIHAADDLSRNQKMKRSEVLAMLTSTVRDVLFADQGSSA